MAYNNLQEIGDRAILANGKLVLNKTANEMTRIADDLQY